MAEALDDPATPVFVADAATPVSAAPPAGATPLSTARQWYLVFTLTIVVMIAMLDRAAFALVVNPIKADFHLSDFEVGLVGAASFAFFQAITALGAGWLVDRFKRKVIIGVGLVLWSGLTMATGLANSFWQLFIGRAGVGFSEGGLGPAAFSMIRDGVSLSRRGRAFSFYSSGSLAGGGLALIGGGAIFGLASHASATHLPFLQAMAPWRWVFVAAGCIGLPVTLLVLGASEPARSGAGVATTTGPGYGASLRYMIRNWRVYLPQALYSGLFGVSAAAYTFWMPALAQRNYHVPISHIGATLGVLQLIAPVVGMLIGGAVTDALTRRGDRNGASLVALTATVLTFAPQALIPQMPTYGWFLTLAAICNLLAGGTIPVTNILLARITPPRSAGKIVAIFLLYQAVLAQALSPLIVGFMSDRFSGPHALANAMTSMAVVFIIPAGICMAWMRRELKRFTAPEDF